MKKYLIAAFSFVFVLAAFAGQASALTTATLNPNSITRAVGDTFDVVINLSPEANVPNYSAKLTLSFNPNLLEVTHFRYADGAMPLSQPGYDVTNNSIGVITKTQGFPGGISRLTTFGVVTFKAKTAGKGIVALSTGSQALDANNNNVYVQSAVAGTLNVTITGKTAVAPTVKKTTTIAKATTYATIVTPTLTPDTSYETEPMSTTTDVDEYVDTTTTDTATSGSVLGASVSNTGMGTWAGIIIGVILLLVIVGLIYSVAREV